MIDRKKLIVGLSIIAGCVEPPRSASSPVGLCGERIEVPIEDGIHVEPPADIEWSSNPPVTGTHYPVWAAYEQLYDTPLLDRGYWLHSVEHGGIALLYNCPQGCADEVARLVAIVRAQPRDPHCAPPLRTRILIAADPLLPEETRFAAVAWGSGYRASCMDEAALATFVAEHYGRAGENTCADGLPFMGTPLSLLPTARSTSSLR